MAPLPEGEFDLPLFPLPNIVFFPHTRLPLHVFEPRYRDLVKDVMEGDQRFGIVLLKPGWETDYFGNPPINAWGTIATVEQSVPLDDGRYNIIVRGDSRFRILREVAGTPYRTARAVAAPEAAPDPARAYEQREWLVELSRQYLQYLREPAMLPELETVNLDALTNALIMSLNLDTEEKQTLLEIGEIAARSERVASELSSRIETLRFLSPYRREGDPSHN